MGELVAGKLAVVTGSTGGVGEGIARMLAAEGASVVVSGRRTPEGHRVVQEITAGGGKAIFHRADVSIEAECLDLVQASVGAFGAVDILVNNAAALAQQGFEELSLEEWDAAYATNVRGPFILSRACARHMRERGGGSIINIGTGMVRRGSMDRIAYSSSKAALLSLTKTMAASLLVDRIRVNWIIVGWVASPQEIELRNHTHGDGKAFLKSSAERRPLGVHESPEDIAAGVLFLASDASSHVTACELNITGGLVI